MGQRLIICCAIFMCVSFAKGSGDNSLKKFAKGNQIFSANVFQQLTKIESGNIVVSPLSAQLILALTSEGARGKTLTELRNGLKLQEDNCQNEMSIASITKSLNQSSEDLKLLSANRIYIAPDFEINGSFQKTAVDVYRSGIEKIDFSNSAVAANTINKWVEDHTNNRIQNLLNPSQLGGGIRLVLVNTLYFSGKWIKAFDHRFTKKGLFHTSKIESKEIDMMNSNLNANYAHNDKLNAKFLQLAFKDSTVTMTFVLPDAIDGLSAVEGRLGDYLEPQDFQETEVAITLPKFTIATTINFIPILQKLGINTVFTSQANLTGISKKEGLLVSFVVQKAFINVTETGTEAAAATAVGVELTAVLPPSNPATFRADHPFLYFLKDEQSGVILFIGRFVQ